MSLLPLDMSRMTSIAPPAKWRGGNLSAKCRVQQKELGDSPFRRLLASSGKPEDSRNFARDQLANEMRGIGIRMQKWNNRCPVEDCRILGLVASTRGLRSCSCLLNLNSSNSSSSLGPHTVSVFIPHRIALHRYHHSDSAFLTPHQFVCHNCTQNDEAL